MRVKRFLGNMYFKQLYYLNSLSVAVHMMHAVLYLRSFSEYGCVTGLILLIKRTLTCWLWGYVIYIYICLYIQSYTSSWWVILDNLTNAIFLYGKVLRLFMGCVYSGFLGMFFKQLYFWNARWVAVYMVYPVLYCCECGYVTGLVRLIKRALQSFANLTV